MNSSRESHIATIKSSLQRMSIVSKNSIRVEAKKEIIRSRRQSLQLAADNFQSQKLLRKFSDEDEEEYRTNANSFDEKYELLQKIGQGANGVVVRCAYRQNGRIYAVKMVKMQQQHYLDLKKNFLYMRMLKHPNIIRYHALYFDHQKHLAYLIMEYFPFHNLLELGIKEENELRVVFGELLVAINYIHERNVCHRDIKPENILYDPNLKRIKIIDFGISKKTFERGQRRNMMTRIGTPFYIAPEILEGGGYDERVDLWCTGITLYKLVTGTTPFESQFHGDTIDKIRQGKIEFGPAWDGYSFFIKDLTKRLIRDRKDRLSAKQALRHLWISLGSLARRNRKCSHGLEDVKFRRHDSGQMKVNREIDEQQRVNIKHAKSKEEGEDILQGQERRFYKQTKLKLMEDKQYEMTDSGEEQTSPGTAQSPEQSK